jgi:hypothetical protein
MNNASVRWNISRTCLMGKAVRDFNELVADAGSVVSSRICLEFVYSKAFPMLLLLLFGGICIH